MTTAVDETALVRAAQDGDAAALGSLLALHEADMRAVAVQVLGFSDEAHDAVQDAMMVALRRIGDLRDPAAVAAWLRSIVRNACRQALRRPKSEIVDDDRWWLRLRADGADPQELLERTVTRDWVWQAIDRLSEADRLVVLLRHFSEITDYEQIASVCGIPVGTVRSRLHHARQKLTQHLRTTADAAYPDASARATSRQQEAHDVLQAAQAGQFEQAIEELWWPDARMVTGKRSRAGRDVVVRVMTADLEDGVRQQVRNVVASNDLLLWETDLISPPDDPMHCPPQALWLHHLSQGRVSRMTLFHPTTGSAVRPPASSVQL